MLAAAVSRRALIVEDDRSSCEVLTKALTLMGHQVESAGTVHQGMRLVKSFAPTHMLLDLMLPDGNGAEILHRIRQRGLPVRVGVITAVGSGRVWDEALLHRPDAIFRKPWDLTEILAWLRRMED